jgi:predicted aspartyl protease
LSRVPTGVLLALAALPAVIAYAALLGLGLHRQAEALPISITATAMVFGPALLAGGFAARERSRVFATVLGVWAMGLLVALPVYFPGERRQAVSSGLALVAPEVVVQWVASGMPPEPEVSHPEIPMAETVMASTPAPSTTALEEHEIALPIEGEGRRLSVPVVFEHGGRTVEVWMMLDTGATYTTLPIHVLEELGAVPGLDDPVIRLHTANGEREASVALLDEVWLGNLSVSGIAIATCDLCEAGDNAGLLGLNVTGAFNWQLRTDSAEVIFSKRAEHDRRLDISPFADISASFSRFPGGRVEVEVSLENLSDRPVRSATSMVQCGSTMWTIRHTDVAPGELITARRRLPDHDPCEGYQISLLDAAW